MAPTRPERWRRRNPQSSSGDDTGAAGMVGDASRMNQLHGFVRFGRDVERACDEIALVQSAARALAHDPAAIHYGNPIAAADQLLVIRAVEQDAGPRIRELPQQAVDLLLGADIDAAGRIVEENDSG